MGYRVIYRLDSFQRTIFKYGVYEKDKIEYDPVLESKVVYQIKEREISHINSVCVVNDFELNSDLDDAVPKSDHDQEFGFFYVGRVDYRDWILFFVNILRDFFPENEKSKHKNFSSPKELLKNLFSEEDRETRRKEMEGLLDQFVMSIYLPGFADKGMAPIKILGSELLDLVTGEFYFKPYDPEKIDYIDGDCQIILGRQTLRKYNFKFYYVEYDLDYEMYYSYDFSTDNYDIDDQGKAQPKKHFYIVLKSLVIAIIVFLIIWYLYRIYR